MDTNDLLRCALQVISRAALPAEQIREIVGSGKKQLHAYNLCDGTRTQTEIAKKSGLNQGNLSRTLTRWHEHGVIFVTGTGKTAVFLHLYPLPPVKKARETRRKNQRKASNRRRMAH